MKVSHRRTALLLTMSLVTALVTLDTTITGVILPSIGRSLHANFSQLEWVISGYMLPFAALLLPAGAWSDFAGRKRTTLIGLGIFAIASLLCGLAPTANWLVAARVVQGAAAALLPTASIAVMGHAFRGEERLRAFAFFGAVIGIATVAGPIVGGLIASVVGWQWAFLVNPPLCLLLIWATVVLADESKDPAAKEFDLPGVITSTAMLGLLTSALIAVNGEGLFAPSVLLRFALAIAFGVLFLRAEKTHRQPMMDLALLRHAPFLGAVTSMLGYASTAQILIFYGPLYLQSTFHVSPLMAGLWMSPFALPLFLMPKWTTPLARRFPPALLLAAGLTLTFVGNVWMALLAHAANYPLFAVGMAIAGIGAGVLNGESAKAFFVAIPPERSGLASGLGTTTRFSGLLIAVAVMGAIFSHAGFAAVFTVQAVVALVAGVATYQLLRDSTATVVTAHSAPVID